MGEVVPARTSPTLLPQSPRTVLSLSCFKVLQCINSCVCACVDFQVPRLGESFITYFTHMIYLLYV